MKKFLTLIFTICALVLIQSSSFAQKESKITPSPLSQAEIDRIIQTFSKKETEFRAALNEYGFKRDAIAQEIGLGGQIAGEFRRISNFSFDGNGVRTEKITFEPMSTLGSFTQEDIQDLGGVNAFALEAAKINQYTFTYVGKEQIDEIGTYVFDVVPKVDLKAKKVSERYFMGRIWVDDKDFQIVKAKGKGVPEGNQRFPIFESYRENVDGKYWFPAYVYADDTLIFPKSTLHIRMLVKFTEYKVGRATVKVIEGDVIDKAEPEPNTQPSPTPTPTPTPTPKKP